MAATFRPVNASFSPEATTENAMPPSAPSFRPSISAQPQLPTQPADSSMAPTLATYTTAIAGQRPLPSSPFPQAVQAREPAGNAPQCENPQRSAKSPARTSMDVEMDESDGETGTVEENPASDDESVNADGSKSSKKKKSQRFYCTDYPPCNLSFTRSEHLARHIRKHTGERPFQCHCSRRFSRLDNLRQHAQTVHVNEDIPMDSLAATGSRFQRQMRNDRTRQAGNRARASTGGSAGGPPRGHSKSLSTSSISSMASVGSAYSAQFDLRRRPPPLIMAADPRSRLSFESYRSNPESTFSHRPPTPGVYTPTSGTLSTHQSSPQWGLEMVAPSSHSRSQSMYSFSSRPPSRRLSVPSGYLTQVPTSGRPSFGPMPANSSNYVAIPSPSNGMMTSPTMSSSDWAARRDSMTNAGDDGWRRRTWHPDSHGFNGNPAQLNAAISQTLRPNPPPPIAKPTDSNPALRLPGIESFDHAALRPASPPRPRPPPLAVDPQMQARPAQMESIQPDDRRNLNRYDVSLQRGLNRLEIGRKTPPRDMLPRDVLIRDSAGVWASEANKAVQAQAERVQQTVRFEEQQQPGIRYSMLMPAGESRSFHQHTMSAPNLVPAREMRRHGYHGPTTMQYEEGLPPQQEVRDPRVDRMIHPNLNEFEGFPARNPPQQMSQQERSHNTDSLRRLEALVAVATSEGTAATAY